MSDESAKPAENGARAMTREEIAIHSVRAQLHAIRAQVDGALAAVALLTGEGAPPRATQRKPQTEAEAQFFGKVRATQESTGANSDAVEEIRA